jgi:hypothetical protein
MSGKDVIARTVVEGAQGLAGVVRDLAGAGTEIGQANRLASEASTLLSSNPAPSAKIVSLRDTLGYKFHDPDPKSMDYPKVLGFNPDVSLLRASNAAVLEARRINQPLMLEFARSGEQPIKSFVYPDNNTFGAALNWRSARKEWNHPSAPYGADSMVMNVLFRFMRREI